MVYAGVYLASRRTVVIVASKHEPDERDLAGQDPEEVLRRMLAISPEDAEEVRKVATEKAEHRD